MIKMTPKAVARREKFKAINVIKEHQNDESWTAFQAKPIRQVGKSSSRSRRRSKGELKAGPTPEYLHWRESVLLRDGYKCMVCGATEKLETDHLQPRHLYPELQYEVSNGQTLCEYCHSQTETYGSRVKRLVSVRVEDITP